jgi:hypothetical protein
MTAQPDRLDRMEETLSPKVVSLNLDCNLNLGYNLNLDCSLNLDTREL